MNKTHKGDDCKVQKSACEHYRASLTGWNLEFEIIPHTWSIFCTTAQEIW